MSPMLKTPKKLVWTRHAEAKMRFYRLSMQKVRSVMHSPKRIEKGIAPDTVAFLQPNSTTSKHPHEIWVMVTDTKKERRVISAWRYPGITKPGETLPEEILREMRSML